MVGYLNVRSDWITTAAALDVPTTYTRRFEHAVYPNVLKTKFLFKYTIFNTA